MRPIINYRNEHYSNDRSIVPVVQQAATPATQQAAVAIQPAAYNYMYGLVRVLNDIRFLLMVLIILKVFCIMRK